MKICMVSSEAVPFIKSGGLADVVSALSHSLFREGEDVRIVLPRFSSVLSEQIRETVRIRVPMGLEEESCTVFEDRLPESDIPVYFIDNPLFSRRPGLYGRNGSHTYRDNSYRFALFSRATLELCSAISWTPDILHSHDWQSALVNAYINELRADGKFTNSKTVFTIHNIGYQGVFSRHDLHSIGLPRRRFSDGAPSYGEHLNYMRTGILNTDAITTVSPTYAEEIRSPEFGEGLEDLLEKRRDSLYGILNGADYMEWDPAHDSLIFAPFSPQDLSGKRENKRALQKELGLPVRNDLPVIGIVSRLAKQKGFYELCDPQRGSLWRICNEMSVQVVVLGTGEDWIEKELVETAGKLPNLEVFVTFSNRLAHLIEAGSDMFLMPSRYEPCGLNQIYSLRYGTLPIVRRTGGLADTVKNYEPQTGEGTGFVFDDLTPDSIYGTTEWAVSTWYEKPEHFDTMRRRAMNQHFSWDDSSRKYRDLYSSLIEG